MPSQITAGRAATFSRALLGAITTLLLLVATPLAAQRNTFIAGTVQSDVGQPIVGATVSIPNTQYGVLTGSGGAFRLGPVPAGTHTVRISAIGYGDTEREVTVGSGQTESIAVVLAARPIELTGIDVSVLRPNMQPESTLQQSEVRQSNPRDVGEALRVVPGVDAVRRGPLGLDPVVRGLRETEVGVYLDGTRQFPAGPARMDSPLSHLDPSALERVEVVKGPYALTWGAGNMSAVRVETQPVPPPAAGAFRGRAIAGYDTNLNAMETAASVFGSSEQFAYWLHGAWREGDDYEAGNGDVIPGDFLSREVRGKLGYQVAPGSWLSLTGGYQGQDDLDYPGRLLDADFFRASNVAVSLDTDQPSGVLREGQAKLYYNYTDHAMDNDEKPTAMPMEGRMPPFALDVDVDSKISVLGGRLAGTLVPMDDWEFEVGGDFYSANRDATRTIARRDNGMVMFTDLMWPDATITDVGGFVRGERFFGPHSLSASVRLDGVWARADTASQFFLENVGTDLESTETNLNGAIVANFALNQNWSLSTGVGSVVRTADVSERYADRIPASKAQTSAEFTGNPTLAPERSTQADVWIDGNYRRATLQVNGFYRRIQDYITLEATDLPKRLPLSPNTVFQYINGEAEFWGADGNIATAVTDMINIAGGITYLYGQDLALDEPALGVSPVRGRLELRLQPNDAFYVEGKMTAAAEQDRVSTSRGELMTPGYAVFDAEAGVTVGQGTQIRFGMNNVFDKQYLNHLNAKNPFTGTQIYEPGRVLFARLTYAF